MTKSSIFVTITVIFILAIISISVPFWWLIYYDKQNYTNELNTRYSVISRLNLYKMGNFLDEYEFQSQMQDYKILEISDEIVKKHIIENAKKLDEIANEFGSSAILSYKNRNFLHIIHNDEILLLQDLAYQPYRYDIFRVIYAVILVILLVLYIFVIRKIKPLRKLKREIKKFAKGDLQIKNVSIGDDEISQVSEAFYDAVMQIKKLNASRHLFLRNIMHELKTPITKGRIVAEMIEQNKNSQRLISIFERLENLINEFALIEQATSNVIVGQFERKSIKEIVDEAVKIAMCEPQRVILQDLQEIFVNVDFKMFCVAVKNLIDNGLKYSVDKSVKIVVNSDKMEFITKGEALEQDFELFLEPFTKGTNAKQSFGLGLYIIDSIAKAHKLKFAYRYENGENIFSFDKFDKIIAHNKNL